jgi:hypothetical protein
MISNSKVFFKLLPGIYFSWLQSDPFFRVYHSCSRTYISRQSISVNNQLIPRITHSRNKLIHRNIVRTLLSQSIRAVFVHYIFRRRFYCMCQQCALRCFCVFWWRLLVDVPDFSQHSLIIFSNPCILSHSS